MSKIQAWCDAQNLHWKWPKAEDLLTDWMQYKAGLKENLSKPLQLEVLSAEASIVSVCLGDDLPDAVLTPTLPKWILLRTFPHGWWVIRDVDTLCKKFINHWNTTSSSETMFAHNNCRREYGAEIYLRLAQRMELVFIGARVAVQGSDVNCFENNASETPRFPQSKSPAERIVGWNYTTSAGVLDTCFQSLASWWCTLQHLLKHTTLLETVQHFLNQWKGNLAATTKIVLEHLCQESLAYWHRIPRHIARRVNRDDYIELGNRMDLILKTSHIPPSTRVKVAWLKKISADTENGSDDLFEEEHCSYLTLHSRYQRFVPTFYQFRKFLVQFEAQHGSLPSLAATQKEFAQCDLTLVQFMYNSIVDSMRQESWSKLDYMHIADGWAKLSHAYEEDIAITGKAQNETQNRLDDLTHPLPPLRVGQKRRAEDMQSLSLSAQTRHGASIGIHRGLRFLAMNYREQLLRYWKHQERKRAQRQLPADLFIDDPDCEEKIQHLPVSPVILQYVASVNALSDKVVQSKLWQAIENCMTTVLHKLERTDQYHWLHEDIIGVVGILIQKSQMPLQLRQPLYGSGLQKDLPKRRLGKKSSSRSDVHDGIANALLSFFGLVAFVEQTEDWRKVPTTVEGLRVYFQRCNINSFSFILS